MPRIIANQLSAVEVAAKIRAGKRGYFSDGGGLWLQVSRYGTASWVYRYRAGGKVREAGLGSAKHIGLADARDLAAAVRKKVILGEDIVADRQERRRADQLDAAKAVTFRKCAERYIAAHSSGWRNPVHAKQWPTTLETYVFPVFGELPVQWVDVGLVMRVLDPIWNKVPETASRVRSRIELVLDYAAARGWRTGDNPARWRGHLDKLLPKPAKAKRAARQANGKGAHHAALPYDELPAFMELLRGREGVTARALEFIILTAGRTGEIVGARWREFNLADRLWIVPGDRMKGGREHRVPLSDAAFEIVNAMKPDRVDPDALVFSGPKGKLLSKAVMPNLLQRMARGDVTAHGFRSAFSDWCAERTNFPSEVREMALAHAIDNKVEAAYRRGDLFVKRRQLLDAWGRYATGPTPAGDVVPLRAGLG